MGKRRRGGAPRWIEKAVYGGPCLNCTARVEPGDRFLYFPDGRLMCQGCGEKFKAEEAAAKRRARDEALARGLCAREVYDGSDSALTRRFCAELEKRGPAGLIAVLLFRAQKSSSRAKLYGRTSYRDLSYGRKGEALKLLAASLEEHSPALGVLFGWGLDEAQAFNRHVLYVDLPSLGQVSFHSGERYAGPDYPGEWDGRRASEERIVAYCQRVYDGAGTY